MQNIVTVSSIVYCDPGQGSSIVFSGSMFKFILIRYFILSFCQFVGSSRSSARTFLMQLRHFIMQGIIQYDVQSTHVDTAAQIAISIIGQWWTATIIVRQAEAELCKAQENLGLATVALPSKKLRFSCIEKDIEVV